MQVIIYLFFNGNCEEAMNFYKDALNGEILAMGRYGDSPMPSGEEEKNKIIHGVLSIQGNHIYCSDTSGKRSVTFGDNFSVSIACPTDESVTSAFTGISAGGTVTMPLQDTFWGAKFGMCRDKFGVNWMFNFEKPKAEDA